MPNRVSNKFIRAIPWLFAVLLLAVVIIWRRHPPTFALVGCYSLSPQFYTTDMPSLGFTNFCPAGLFLDSVTPHMDELISPHKYALFNWDGRLCWTVNTPSFNPAGFSKGDHRALRQRFQTISTDGHTLAVAKLSWSFPTIIQRWRDGQPDGLVALPWKRLDCEAAYEKRLQVCDNGRIWFKNSLRQLWAIDGTHFAYGICPPSRSLGLWSVSSFLSRDGTMVEQRCMDDGKSDYFDVQVNGDQVLTTHHALPAQLTPLAKTIGGKVVLPPFNGSRPPETDGWFYCADERTDIYCQKIGSRYRIIDPRQQIDWAFTLAGVARWIRSSPDGRFALVLAREVGQPSNGMKMLARLPVLRDMMPAKSYLLLYEHPGRLRAQLRLTPLDATASIIRNWGTWNWGNSLHDAQIDACGRRYNIQDWGMSPDSHRLGLLVNDGRKQQALLIYKW